MATDVNAQIAQNLMYRSMTQGAATSEFDHYGGYGNVKDTAYAAGASATPEWIAAYEKQQGLPPSDYTIRNKGTTTPAPAEPSPTPANTPSTPGAVAPVTAAPVTPTRSVGSTPSAPVGTRGLISGADSLSGLVTMPLSQTGAGGLLTSSMLTAPKAATAAMPAGTPASTGWNFGTAQPTPGVETWMNATTGKRVTYPVGSPNPGAGWTKV